MRQARTMIVAVLAAVLAGGPAAAQVKSVTAIKYPKLKEFAIEKPQVRRLDNGMTVFLIEDHELPLVRVSMRVRTGSYYEPADRAGLGALCGQLLREGGTSSMSGDEIDEYLAARAAVIETGVGGDVGQASMNCLTEDFADVFAVLGNILRHPVFAQDKIEVAKTQLNSAIARRNDNIAGVTAREFNRLIYGADTPLGRLTEYSTLAKVTRDDLIAWHAKYYHPNNIYLGVVGDFDPAKIQEQIQRTFGDWARGPAFAESEVPYARQTKPGIYFIEKSDVTQANVRLGHLGITTKNPDYFAVEVLNEVLGGGFAGRLFSNVRSKKGLAYSVSGGVGSSFAREGVFQVGLSTKSATMAAAVEALREEIRRIIDEPPQQEELDRAKESILNSFVFRFDSKQEILDEQLTYAYYGMPPDFLDIYRKNIEKVTGADVAQMARKYIHPDTLALLVVGKSQEFDRPVASFGEVRPIDITIPPPPDARPRNERSTSNREEGAPATAGRP